MTKQTCHDCGVSEGQIHEYGCDMERCPFCGHQLISCRCAYKQLGLIDRVLYSPLTNHLPPEVYANGLSEEQEDRWLNILNERGRVPYILYPVVCGRCGALWPDLFQVPTAEWSRYIQIDMQDQVICRPCYDEIKRLIDVGCAQEREG